MPFTPLDSTLYTRLFPVDEIAHIFSDEESVARMLQVEVALARVQENLGLIPEGAAEAIARAVADLDVDYATLARGTEEAGLPVIELLHQLRERVGSGAASYVHWGATTQDIMDSGLVLQMSDALDFIDAELMDLIGKLAQLADEHRHTLMAGRTHSQQALPITFGLKVAGWLAPLLEHRRRLAELRPRLLVLQFGGAAGTLSALGSSGIDVADALAQELGLGLPLLPWHTRRDGLVECAGWLSMLSGTLAKMAQDIILLSQSEVGEVRESADPNRGGSSTMPQKRNPVVSEVIIAVARTNASLLSSVHQAQIQEHERGTHGWQMEWLALPQMFGLSAVALNRACFLAENLVVDSERMAANVAASRGLMLAEAISFALTEWMPRSEAKAVVGEAVQTILSDDGHLVDVVRSRTELELDWEHLREERNYLGATQQYIDRVLSVAQSMMSASG